LDRSELEGMIAAHFETDSMPLMVALLRLEGRQALEVERGFVVPDGWRERAVQRRANTD
jgi:DNA-binding GntR family transcriptional regulator